MRNELKKLKKPPTKQHKQAERASASGFMILP
jgi:hypothetical protein